MPDKPQRDIEKLLRAYAGKRKEDAGTPPEMHPATRRLLQDEVARRAKRSPPERNFFTQIFDALRPRWAFAVSVVGITLIAAALLLPTLQKAKTKGASETVFAANELKQLAPATPPPAPVAAKAAPTGGADVPALALNKPAPADFSVSGDADGIARSREKSPPRGETVAGTLTVTATASTNALLAFGAGVVSDGKANSDALGLRDGAEIKLAEDDRKPAGAPAAPQVASAPEPVYSTVAVDKARGLLLDAEAKKETERFYANRALEKSVHETPPAALAPTVSGGKLAASPAAVESEWFVARGGGERARVAQRYTQVARADESLRRQKVPAESSPAKPILTSFQFEQRGNEVRITDEDGSVYKGFVLLATTRSSSTPAKTNGRADGGEALKFKDAVVKADRDVAGQRQAEAQTEKEIPFRAEGTNRSLNQRIVVNGSYQVLTNLVAYAWTNAVDEFAKQPAQAAVPATILNSRITGKARLADGAEFEINAVPVAP